MTRELIDSLIFLIANLTNILLSFLFLLRSKGHKKAENILGIVLISFAVPLLIFIVVNVSNEETWWRYILPLPLVFFFLIELVLDYILKIEFRKTKLLWPYLLVFYMGLMGMIGYSFLVNKTYGYITLTTYFINLAATYFTYSNSGHG